MTRREYKQRINWLMDIPLKLRLVVQPVTEKGVNAVMARYTQERINSKLDGTFTEDNTSEQYVDYDPLDKVLEDIENEAVAYIHETEADLRKKLTPRPRGPEATIQRKEHPKIVKQIKAMQINGDGERVPLRNVWDVVGARYGVRWQTIRNIWQKRPKVSILTAPDN